MYEAQLSGRRGSRLRMQKWVEHGPMTPVQGELVSGQHTTLGSAVIGMRAQQEGPRPRLSGPVSGQVILR